MGQTAFHSWKCCYSGGFRPRIHLGTLATTQGTSYEELQPYREDSECVCDHLRSHWCCGIGPSHDFRHEEPLQGAQGDVGGLYVR